MNNSSPKNFKHLFVSMDCDRDKNNRNKCYCGHVIPLNTQYRTYMCLVDGKYHNFNVFDHNHIQESVAVGQSSYKVPSPPPKKIKKQPAIAKGKSSYKVRKPTKKGLVDRRGRKPKKI